MGKRLKALAALRERWSYRRYARGRVRDQRPTERGAEMIQLAREGRLFRGGGGDV
jgi:hypothetical protein